MGEGRGAAIGVAAGGSAVEGAQPPPPPDDDLDLPDERDDNVVLGLLPPSPAIDLLHSAGGRTLAHLL
ncbi:hypothetical protein [Oryza sativa Japonica Group]|uniref:Uncharacterized protein n=1 Tax=Oryza sativa subsp. japonica TaxID=39947 RepID=Q5JNS4_ORYSJ|nr:hypothetical protein [Oryza sativa Japonica Group]